MSKALTCVFKKTSPEACDSFFAAIYHDAVEDFRRSGNRQENDQSGLYKGHMTPTSDFWLAIAKSQVSYFILSNTH
jgi:hypothetical protein